MGGSRVTGWSQVFAPLILALPRAQGRIRGLEGLSGLESRKSAVSVSRFLSSQLAFLEPSYFSESPTLITCGLAPCPGNAVQPLLPLLDTACLVQISSSLSISTSCLAAMLAVRNTRGLFPTHPSQSQDSLDSICISRHVKSPYSGLRCDLKRVTAPLDSHAHEAAGLGHVCVCMCCFFH